MLNILGINIHNYSKVKIRRKLTEFLAGDKPRQIVTVNPEFVLRAQRDEEFFYILNKADLALPDGVGLVFAGLFLFYFIRRATGVWLCEELLNNKKIKKVLVVNWNQGLQDAGEIKAGLEKKYPKTLFLVIDVPRSDPELDWRRIESFGAQAVLSTLGAPWQEKILFLNKSRFKGAKILVGIGGALDYLSGRVKRAPKAWRFLGLEWLYRLIRQPRRLKRIYGATVKFSQLFLSWRLVLPFRYRRNVACLLYKKAKNSYSILMVERSDQPGHWQIPQGGLDSSDIKEAGLKELREEVGVKNIRYITHTGFIHKYKFPFDTGCHRAASYRRHAGYKGQKQALLIAEYRGDDSDIRINYWDHSAWQWVAIENAIDIAHKARKPSLKKYLKIFNNFIVNSSINAN